MDPRRPVGHETSLLGQDVTLMPLFFSSRNWRRIIFIAQSNERSQPTGLLQAHYYSRT